PPGGSRLTGAFGSRSIAMATGVGDVRTGRLVSASWAEATFPGGYDRPGEDFREEIRGDVIRSAVSLDTLAFTVTVTGGVVTVSGLVERDLAGLSLLPAVRQVDGVVAVRKQLSYPPLWTGDKQMPEVVLEHLDMAECMRLIAPGGIGRLC